MKDRHVKNTIERDENILEQSGLGYFVVVESGSDGASSTNNRGRNGAARHARLAHIRYEKAHKQRYYRCYLR